MSSLVHIVFWRFKERALGRNKAENAAELARQLLALPDQIPDIRSFEVGADVVGSPASFDLALLSVFDSREALERYRAHPAHVAVLPFIEAVTADRAVVDYIRTV